MPHRPAMSLSMGQSDMMIDYIVRNRLTPEEFESIYRRDHHGEGLSAAQKRVIAREVRPFREEPKARTRFTTRRRSAAFVIFRRVPGASYVQVTKGTKVMVKYIKDKRGQLHKQGADGRFQRFTQKERRGFGLSRRLHKRVKRSRPSADKKPPVEG